MFVLLGRFGYFYEYEIILSSYGNRQPDHLITPEFGRDAESRCYCAVDYVQELRPRQTITGHEGQRGRGD
jgi:hypothetical protein